jgi:cobalamin biosynthesis protein CobT
VRHGTLTLGDGGFFCRVGYPSTSSQSLCKLMTKGEEAGITNQGGEDDTEDEEEDEEEEKEGVREQHEEHGEHVKSKETDDEGWGRQEEHGGQGEYGGHSDTPNTSKPSSDMFVYEVSKIFTYRNLPACFPKHI